MRHYLDDTFFAGLKANERHSSGNLKLIIIGGDFADIIASSATNETVKGESGVMLWNACLIGSDLNHPPEYLRDMADTIVRDCYASIQEDTFNQTRRDE